MSCRFLSLGNLQRHSPSPSSAQHGVEPEDVTHQLLGEGWVEDVIFEDHQCLGSHLELMALARQFLALRMTQQDAGAQIEGVHQQVKMRIKTREMLSVIT